MPTTQPLDSPAPQTAAGQRLVYLDNAATSYPKPAVVVEAVRAALGQALTVQRSTHAGQFRPDEVLRRCRIKLAALLGARQPEEIVYTYSATDALNLALSGMVTPGGHVLTSPLEHHSVMRPLHAYRASRGASFEALPADELGAVDPTAIRRLRRPETCAVVINWISNVSGTIQPIAEIGAVCRELGLPYLIDASQGTGSHPIDVRAAGCDAMAQPAHKALLSLPGLGVLYLREGFELPSWRVGGTGQRSELLEHPTERPLRYESGTPNVPAIIGLDAALDWIAERGVEAIAAHCAALTQRLRDGLAELEGVELVGRMSASPVRKSNPPEKMTGEGAHPTGHLVSFTVADTDPLVFAELLAQHGVSSRAGLHCAPTAHHYFGSYDRGGTVRLSVGATTTAEDVELALAALQTVLSILR